MKVQRTFLDCPISTRSENMQAVFTHRIPHLCNTGTPPVVPEYILN